MYNSKIRPMILSLFDGGDGAAAAPAATGEGQGPTGETTAASDAGRENGVQATSNTLEERKAAYRAFKEGKYKDLFDADVQGIVNRRFRETKQLQAQVEGYQPVIDLLAERLHLDGKDPKALLKGLKEDSLYLERAADEAGLSVEQYREREDLLLENRRLLEAEQRRRGEEAVQRDVARWVEEEKSIKAKYPGFNLRTEMQDPRFINLARDFSRNGFANPVELAYASLHMNELLNSAVTNTAAATEQKVVANVRAKGARPAEAGNSAQAAATVKKDPSKLTKAERADYIRRVYAGERIEL